MKKSDLYREWARVLDMCEGAGVDPLICWKYEGTATGNKPELDSDPDLYTFAVAILEDKPVFVGDKVYHKSGTEWIVFGDANLRIVNWVEYSWNPPKKTFMLNGVELPCPVFDIPKSSLSIRAYFPGIQETATFNFPDEYDAQKVIDVISKLLMDNTK